MTDPYRILDRLNRGKTPTAEEAAVLRDALTEARTNRDRHTAALDRANARLADRIDELAHALGRDRCDDDWEDLIEIAAGLPAADRDARAARQGEAEAVRARQAAEQQAAAADVVTGAAKTLLARRTNTLRARAEQAEAEAHRLRLMVDEYSAGASGLGDKLREAEAAITRVREAVAVALQHENPLGLTCQCGVDHLGHIHAAVGGEQPAAPADPCAHRSWELRRPSGWADDMPPGSRWCLDCDERLAPGPPIADPCAHGCRDAADEHTRLSQEIDTEAEPECGCGADACEVCTPMRHGMTTPERQQPAEPLLRGTAPLVISIDLGDYDLAAVVRRFFGTPGGRP